MRIQIDGIPADLASPTGELAEVLSAITSHCTLQKRAVVGLLLDDVPFTVGTGDLPSSSRIRPDSLLEVKTGPMREVAGDVLQGCAEHLTKVLDVFTMAARELRGNDPRAGMVTLEKGLHLFIQLVEGAGSAMKVLGRGWEDVRASDGSPAEEVMGRLNRLLEETQRAFENSDTVELGDILDYDFPPLLRAHQEILHELAAKAREPLN